MSIDFFPSSTEQSEAGSYPYVPVSIDELAETAKRAAREMYEFVEDPDDVRPLLLVASSHTPGAAELPMPSAQDRVARVRVACAYVPIVLAAYEATGCALVLPPAAGREGNVLITLHDFRGDALLAAPVGWDVDGRAQLGLFHSGGGEERAELSLFSDAVHAALGRFEFDAPSPAAEVELAIVAVGSDVAAVDGALRRACWQSPLARPWISVRVNSAGVETVIVHAQTASDRDLARALLHAAGIDVHDASFAPKQIHDALKCHAIREPLFAVGYELNDTAAEIFTEGELTLLDLATDLPLSRR